MEPNMNWQYLVKAAYAAAMSFLGGVGAVLVAPDMGFSDISAGQWVVIATFTLGAFGGILGWQQAPASVSTSVRE